MNIKLLKCLLPGNSALFFYMQCNEVNLCCNLFLARKGRISTDHLSLHPILGLLCVPFVCSSHHITLLLIQNTSSCFSHSQFFFMFYTMRVSSIQLILYCRFGRMRSATRPPPPTAALSSFCIRITLSFFWSLSLNPIR